MRLKTLLQLFFGLSDKVIINMFTYLIILLIYFIVLLELFFNDSLIVIRYLHFGYLAFFLFSTSLMIVLAVKRTKKALLFLPAFIFIGIHYLTPFVTNNPPLTDITNRNEPFKVLSYSINSRNKKYDETAQLLKQNPADIICLQEIPYSRYQHFIASLKNAGVNYHHVYSRKKALMILSTQAITPHKTMPYLQASIVLKGNRLKIWNLHSPKSLTRKNYQSFYFDKLMADIKADQSDHKLVCGDFNSTPHNDIVNNFMGVLQAAYKSSAYPASFTYPTPKGIIPSPLPFLKIDYLLFTSNFKIDNYQRITQYANSDHYPIMATARFQEQL